VGELIGEVDRVVFDLTASKLQIEITAQFAHELADRGSPDNVGDTEVMTDGAIEYLHASSCETVRRALSRLAAIRGKVKTVERYRGEHRRPRWTAELEVHITRGSASL
jgi:hypothetical protein